MHTHELINKLISANHILHYHKCFDAFGNISVRSPNNPNHFLMARELAPALVSSDADINVYAVSDASTVAPYSPKGPHERFIHSEIYKTYPVVICVCHSHAPVLIPFRLTCPNQTNLKILYPVHPMAGFPGEVFGTETWDAEELYSSAAYQDQPNDMLVMDQHLGRSLAKCFHYRKRNGIVVLMRNHGYTTVAKSIESAVYQAIYLQQNAQILRETDQ